MLRKGTCVREVWIYLVQIEEENWNEHELASMYLTDHFDWQKNR